VDSAQVGLDQAKSKLDQAKIIAPFNGTVAAVNYVVGQLAPAGSSTAVITLVNLDNLQTQLTLSEVDIAKVKPDQTVDLSIDALGGRSFPGKIISISPIGTVTQGVVNYLVTVALTQPDASIKPGMTASATITVDRRDNVLLVPNRAIRTQGNQRTITVLFEGKDIPVTVTIGLNNDQNSEITSATGPNGQPITLQDGDTVLLNTTTTGGLRILGGGGIPFGGGRPPGD
jgi:RND family efflux transporter MFP subunit